MKWNYQSENERTLCLFDAEPYVPDKDFYGVSDWNDGIIL